MFITASPNGRDYRRLLRRAGGRGKLIDAIFVAAMHKRMTVHELAAMPHYHPTLAEIWTYPAEEWAAQIPGQSPGELML